MMRIGIISDIHGNLQALDAVLADSETRGVDALYCLGDLVGYAPFPNEVTERIRATAIPTIMGNYDDGLGSIVTSAAVRIAIPSSDSSAINPSAGRRHTSRQRTRRSCGRCSTSSASRRTVSACSSCTAARAKSTNLFEDRPVSSFQRLAASSNADIIVFGHTHRPYTKLVDSVLFVNAGSVGKPKDGDWRACYAILDLNAPEPVQFVRVAYDVATVATAIRASELPDQFAADIERGGTPVAAAK